MGRPALPPATTSDALAKIGKGDVRFIQILKDDFSFDLIQEMVAHLGVVKRSKKLKPETKHRMLQAYYMKLLEFCVPKLKVQEGAKDVGDKIQFNINVGGEPTIKDVTPKGGVNITIPATKTKDGIAVNAKE